jgi:D-amino-acid dehydrogenase
LGHQHFTVIGAGAVGVCSALYLQREGHKVTLIDRIPPGRGCSYGNAGLVQTGATVPIATPGVLRQVPRMLLDPDQPLVIRWQYLPRLMPYLARFVAAARPTRVEEISKALASLLSLAADSYKDLLAGAGSPELLQHSGELYVYETEASYLKAKAGHDLRRRRGIRVEEIPAHELRQLEPALAPIFTRAVLLPDSLKTVDPYLVVSRLAEDFRARGGEILQAEAEDVEVGPEGPRELVTSAGRRKLDRLVVAAGAYSKRWAKRFGSGVPLDTERGYHLTLPDPGIRLRVPIVSGDYRFGIAQIGDGIRLAGTAELARVDAAPNYARAERLLRLGQRVLPELRGEGRQSWMGHRPSTPDSLPVIDRSPRFPGVYYAFGHGHLGLTLGAATGRVLAELVAGRKPPVELAPFRVTRF